MKVAILTLPLHTNYGGILQAYALQIVLERMGHEVVVLDPKKVEQKVKMTPLLLIKACYRFFKKIFINHRTVIFREKHQIKVQHLVSKRIQRFIDKNLNLYQIDALSDIKEADFDAFVVGSDQIWRPVYFKRMWKTSIDNAFLSFTKGWNVKRVAYAASFGVDNNEYSSEEVSACSSAIKSFDIISVREASGVDLCRDLFGSAANHVLDPTMLLKKEDYEFLVESNQTPKSSGNLLAYILDMTPEKKGIIERIAREKKLTPFCTNEGDYDKKNCCEIKRPVESWIRGFMDAEFVITDSFHACVFSIIFGKPFIAIANESRGTGRFLSLLQQFGLERNLIFNVSEYNPDYNYFQEEKVEKQLEKLRINSYESLNLFK